MKETNYLIVDDYMLNGVLDKITFWQMTIGIKKFDNNWNIDWQRQYIG